MSGEVSDETAFPRASLRVNVGRIDVWKALGEAVSAENEPRSVAETYFQKGTESGHPVPCKSVMINC